VIDVRASTCPRCATRWPPTIVSQSGGEAVCGRSVTGAS
jgi:hypothetical protein